MLNGFLVCTDYVKDRFCHFKNDQVAVFPLISFYKCELLQLFVVEEDLKCRKYFYRMDNLSNCEPQCATWSQYGEAGAKLLNTTIIIHDVIGFVAIFGIFIISSIKYKIV